jgi:hypothetical protein
MIIQFILLSTYPDVHVENVSINVAISWTINIGNAFKRKSGLYGYDMSNEKNFSVRFNEDIKSLVEIVVNSYFAIFP